MFDELRLGGFVEGQNLTVVGDFGVTPAQIPDGVDRVVKAAPDAIVSGPELYARAFRAATRTIPLIAISEDLVAEGLVASLAKPGGNLTGISLLSPELDDKRQDILIEAVPGIRRLAALADVSITQKRHLEQQKQTAQSLGVELSVFTFAQPGAFQRLSTRLSRAGHRRLIFWRRQSSRSAKVSSSNGWRHYACPRSINGLIRQTTVA